MRNPFLQKRWTLILYIISWFLMFIIHTIISVNILNLSVLNAIIDNFAFSVLSAFAGLSLWFIVKFNNLENLSIERIIINHVFTAIVIISFINLLSFLVFLSLHSFSFNYFKTFDNQLIVKIILSVVYYISLITIYYFQILNSNFREQQLREIKLQSKIKDAEITALKARINPHFLFNSLNSASSLTITNPVKAQEMIIKLAEYFRFSLTKSNVTEVKIEDEIENALLYLEIEKIRFKDKLVISKVVSLESENITIPAMLLQPIFENAIKHGVYESAEKSIIEFSCIEENFNLTIKLKNNFSLGFKKSGTGSGLKLVKERLNLHYGDNYVMEIYKENNMFEIVLKLPLKSNYNPGIIR